MTDDYKQTLIEQHQDLRDVLAQIDPKTLSTCCFPHLIRCLIDDKWIYGITCFENMRKINTNENIFVISIHYNFNDGTPEWIYWILYKNEKYIKITTKLKTMKEEYSVIVFLDQDY